MYKAFELFGGVAPERCDINMARSARKWVLLGPCTLGTKRSIAGCPKISVHQHGLVHMTRIPKILSHCNLETGFTFHFST